MLMRMLWKGILVDKCLVVEENVVEDNVVQQDVVEVNTLQYNALQENMQRKNVMENVEYTVADNGIANTDDNNVAIADETKNVNAYNDNDVSNKSFDHHSDGEDEGYNMELGCKGFGRSVKRIKDSPHHKDKMMSCKQEEAEIQLSVEQQDWILDLNEEPTK
ncbi:hypothetical protein Tco_1485450 [Tanacetum coccineum]